MKVASKVILTAVREETMKEIFCPTSGLVASYPAMLRHLYNINDLLKKDGILAPSDSSLTNTTRLYDLIGRPLDKIPTLHIGGTNGKGSTSFKLSESLSSCGLRTGLFVSPHLASYRERVQVDAQLISEEAFTHHLPEVLKLCADHSIPATLFELTFILACLHYRSEKCEVVVLEVGLGGELDATNVVNTALSIICSVSLDHTRILGSTVEEIATKKAGIFKKGVPALVGPGCPMSVIKSVAAGVGADLHYLPEVYDRNRVHGLYYRGKPNKNGEAVEVPKNIPGANFSSLSITDMDELNAHIAFSALCLLKEKALQESEQTEGDGITDESNVRKDLYSPFKSVDVMSHEVQSSLQRRPSCRWEVHTVSSVLDADKSVSTGKRNREHVEKNGDNASNTTNGTDTSTEENGSVRKLTPRQVVVEVVLDVGHNPAAMEALSKRIKDQFPGRGIRVLYAMSRDKDVRTCVRHIVGVAPHDHIHFAQSKNFRAISLEKLREIFEEETGHKDYKHIESESVKDMVGKVIALAAADSVVNADGQSSVVVICGTGYIMPDARSELGIKEPRDDVDLLRDL